MDMHWGKALQAKARMKDNNQLHGRQPSTAIPYPRIGMHAMAMPLVPCRLVA
jgi:hypothetical protein